MRHLVLIGVLAGVAAPAAAESKVDYAKQVEPIFAARCYKCHGEKKGLGGLRMHTGELIAALEDDGLVVPGDAESSEIYSRLVLPADDKYRMPKGGDPLDAEQIGLIKAWIEEGAVLTSAAAAGGEPMEEHADDHGNDQGHDHEAADADEPPSAASPESIKKLTDVGASVVPLFAGSTLLSVGFPSQPGEVTDDTVDLIAAIGANVAWLDLGRSKVTDAGAMKLAGLPNLKRLHLERTGVTDACVGTLAGIAKLEYLNLYATEVTDAALAELESAPQLKRLYVWQTNVSFDAAKKMMAAKEGLEINLGWDHPGVVRDRLTRELTAVTERKDVAAREAAEAEQKLADAKTRLESATSREAELKAELEALDKPAEPAEEQPAEAKAGEEKPADEKPADEKPAEDKPADKKV